MRRGLAERFAALFEDSRTLEGVARNAQPFVYHALTKSERARRFKHVLHGDDWLGHALHPMLTDMPIGAWTLAGVFDAIPQTALAADICVGIGVAAALPTALAGITDWTQTEGTASRIGVAHAAFNVTALMCFAASLALRARNRRAGVAMQAMGNIAATCGAMLGGHLVYKERVGVKPQGTSTRV